jgi:hypothetical protein
VSTSVVEEGLQGQVSGSPFAMLQPDEPAFAFSGQAVILSR